MDDDVSGSQAHYRIDAFGERFHLNLTADSSFIAPSYAVQHLGAEPNDTADSHHYYPQDPSNMRHCFFRGHVNAKTHFPAVFSLCTGLVSMRLSFFFPTPKSFSIRCCCCSCCCFQLSLLVPIPVDTGVHV